MLLFGEYAHQLLLDSLVALSPSNVTMTRDLINSAPSNSTTAPDSSKFPPMLLLLKVIVI
jgi:hypothetical protein